VVDLDVASSGGEHDLGLALGGGILGLWATLDRVTIVRDDEVATAPGDRARLRRLLDPWDALASLAWAWASLRDGDTARAATPSEVKELRHEAKALKEVVADLTLENRLLKKSMTEDGDDEA